MPYTQSMSSFSIRVHTLDVSRHPDADRLDIVRPGGTLYVAIALRDSFVTGDEAVYVPEGAVVPERVLRAASFWDEEKGKGMLAGARGDRVKAIRLRGVLSQGILLTVDTARDLLIAPVSDDGDWASALGITKYQPPIPREMSGQAYHQPGLHGYTDIESIKNYPDAFHPGETVHVSEKLHGSCSVMSLLRGENDWVLHVSSKGMAQKALALQEAENNVYWRSARSNDIERKLREYAQATGAQREVTLFGETLGVQDLMYGLSGGQVAFRAFEIRVDGMWVNAERVREVLAELDVPMVPALYTGPYDAEHIWSLASGKTEVNLSEGKRHLREGVVVRPAREHSTLSLSRVIIKFVSADYLTRKGNATELE